MRTDMLSDVRTPALTPRPVAASVEELLDGATSREPFFVSDSKSGSPFERVIIDGESFILKHVHIDDDWTMRFNGDVGCKPAQVWQSGLMDVLPERIDHAVVGVAAGLGRNGWGAALLMHDRSEAMVPPGDTMLSMEQHLSLLDDLAALSACMWGWRDDALLTPLENRWTWFGHASLEVEAVRGWPDPCRRSRPTAGRSSPPASRQPSWKSSTRSVVIPEPSWPQYARHR